MAHNDVHGLVGTHETKEEDAGIRCVGWVVLNDLPEPDNPANGSFADAPLEHSLERMTTEKYVGAFHLGVSIAYAAEPGDSQILASALRLPE